MLNGICPKCNFLVTRKVRDREHINWSNIKDVKLVSGSEWWREYSCIVCRHVWFAERTANGWLKGTPPEGLFDE
jgi:hypothetical protein